MVTVRPDPGAMMGRPSSPSRRRGKSLTEGASQILGTNDSTVRQLKPPHPSHVEGPISPRRLGLATYPNPRPLTWPSFAMNIYKPPPTRSGRRLPQPASFGSRNPAQERFPFKSLLDTLLVSWSPLPNSNQVLVNSVLSGKKFLIVLFLSLK